MLLLIELSIYTNKASIPEITDEYLYDMYEKTIINPQITSCPAGAPEKLSSLKKLRATII